MLRLICKKIKLLFLYSFKLVLIIGYFGLILVDDLLFFLDFEEFFFFFLVLGIIDF